jgi:hypothetical protein
MLGRRRTASPRAKSPHHELAEQPGCSDRAARRNRHVGLSTRPQRKVSRSMRRAREMHSVWPADRSLDRRECSDKLLCTVPESSDLPIFRSSCSILSHRSPSCPIVQRDLENEVTTHAASVIAASILAMRCAMRSRPRARRQLGPFRRRRVDPNRDRVRARRLSMH